MVKSAAPTLDAVFGALADPTRRSIVARLARDGEVALALVADPFQMSLVAVSKHVSVLERAGLVERRRVGRERRCRLRVAALAPIAEWLRPYEQMWNAQFDRLEAYLDRHSPPEENAPCPPPAPQRKTRPSASAARSTPRPSASSRRSRRPKP